MDRTTKSFIPGYGLFLEYVSPATENNIGSPYALANAHSRNGTQLITVTSTQAVITNTNIRGDSDGGGVDEAQGRTVAPPLVDVHDASPSLSVIPRHPAPRRSVPQSVPVSTDPYLPALVFPERFFRCS
ncbi:hypothetical protein J6590_017396 [Homalodisca vitripennis]|nr:hypothetical protein J6590_017396 [Homalodisca vitripennis]